MKFSRASSVRFKIFVILLHLWAEYKYIVSFFRITTTLITTLEKYQSLFENDMCLEKLKKYITLTGTLFIIEGIWRLTKFELNLNEWKNVTTVKNNRKNVEYCLDERNQNLATTGCVDSNKLFRLASFTYFTSKNVT